MVTHTAVLFYIHIYIDVIERSTHMLLCFWKPWHHRFSNDNTLYRHRHTQGGACGVVGKRHGNMSSNPRWGWLHFAKH